MADGLHHRVLRGVVAIVLGVAPSFACDGRLLEPRLQAAPLWRGHAGRETAEAGTPGAVSGAGGLAIGGVPPTSAGTHPGGLSSGGMNPGGIAGRVGISGAATSGAAASGGTTSAGGLAEPPFDPTCLPVPNDGNHNAGLTCLDCHRFGGEGPRWLFAGTVFSQVDAGPVPHVEVSVHDGERWLRTCSARNGNFWLPAFERVVNWPDAEVRVRTGNLDTRCRAAPSGPDCNGCHLLVY